jgi:hypothetical protein
MRLPLIAPADLTPEQKPLYDDMRKGISSNFNAFKAVREDGALMGRGIRGCTSRESARRFGTSRWR